MTTVHIPVTLTCLLVVSLEAQTFHDSFDDNLRDVVNWSEPSTYEGNGQLLEQNQRLEFSAGAFAENAVEQGLKISLPLNPSDTFIRLGVVPQL